MKYAAEIEKLEKRKEMKRRFYELVDAKNAERRANKAERAALRGGPESDREEDYTVTDEVIETVVKTVEQVA